MNSWLTRERLTPHLAAKNGQHQPGHWSGCRSQLRRRSGERPNLSWQCAKINLHPTPAVFWQPSQEYKLILLGERIERASTIAGWNLDECKLQQFGGTLREAAQTLWDGLDNFSVDELELHQRSFNSIAKSFADPVQSWSSELRSRHCRQWQWKFMSVLNLPRLLHQPCHISLLQPRYRPQPPLLRHPLTNCSESRLIQGSML